jgi:hypothetical protein
MPATYSVRATVLFFLRGGRTEGPEPVHTLAIDTDY